MDNLSSTTKKIIAGVGVAAAAALAFSYYEYSSAEAKANELKEAGNRAFKAKDYREAVDLYTQAAKASRKNKWIYYANRSAAYHALQEPDNALADALEAIRLNDTWPKGYYRAGRAAADAGDAEAAYSYFYKSSTLERTDELVRLLEGTRDRLSRTSKSYSFRCADLTTMDATNRKILDDLARKFGLSDSISLERDLTIALPTYKNNIATVEPFKTYAAASTKDFWMFVFRTCALAMNKPDVPTGAMTVYQSVMMDVTSRYPNDPDLLIYSCVARMQANPMDESVADDLIKAARADPPRSEITVLFILSVMQLTAFEMQNGIEDGVMTKKRAEISKALIACFDQRSVELPILVSTCLSLWAHTEKRKADTYERPIDESLPRMSRLKSEYNKLTSKSRAHFMSGLYLRVLTEVVNDQSLTVDVRAALLHYAEDGEGFRVYGQLLYALAIQSYLSGYAVDVKPEDNDTIEELKEMLEARIKNEGDKLVVDGELERGFSIKLASVALYEAPHHLEGIYDIVKKIDLTKLDPFLAKLVKLTLLNKMEEGFEEMGLESVTPIKDLTTLSHRDTMIRQSIKTARGVPLRVAKISQRDVLEGMFPNFTFPHMPHHPTVLVTSAGSGVSAVEYSSVYNTTELDAIELSPRNVVFARREAKDNNCTGIHYMQGEAAQITAKTFGGKKYDFAVVEDLSFYADARPTLKAVSSVMKPGAVIKATVVTKFKTEVIRQMRRTAADEFPHLFDVSLTPVGVPTDAELRNVTEKLIQSADNMEILTRSDVFSLVFTPHCKDFSYETIEELIKGTPFKLLGYELPFYDAEQQPKPDWLLEYKVEYPTDTHLTNGKFLTEFFSKKSEGRLPNDITFYAQLPL